LDLRKYTAHLLKTTLVFPIWRQATCLRSRWCIDCRRAK
jgi:hypothetical protein